MQALLDRRLLDPYIDQITNRLVFLYGANRERIRDRFKQLNNLYATDERDDCAMFYNLENRSIYVITSNISYENGRLNINDSNRSTFEENIIHELLHALSHTSNNTGIRGAGQRTGLNEGITQMFADDIRGSVTTKYFDGYFALKNVAKIFRAIFGNEVLLNSYFDSEGERGGLLEDSVNQLSGNTASHRTVFDNICHRMDTLLTIDNVVRRAANINDNHLVSKTKEVYNKYEDLLYNYVVLRVVVPFLNRQSDSSKKTYIRNLITALGDDSRTKNRVITLLQSYIGLTPSALNQEVRELENKTTQTVINGGFFIIVTQGQDFTNNILARRDGTVIYLGNPNEELTSQVVLTTVYETLFDNKYGCKMSDDYVETIYNNIIAGNNLTFSGMDTLEKRIVLCGIKKYVRALGINILNDYRELDNKEVLNNIMYIKNNTNTNIEGYDIIDFDDAKKLCERYGVYYATGNISHLDVRVKDKITGLVIENPYIVNAVKIANNWMLTTGYRNNGSVENIEAAFDPSFRIPFEDVLHATFEDFIHEGPYERTFPYYYLHNYENRPLLERFLASPEQYEWVNDYFYNLRVWRRNKVYKGISYNEYMDNNYLSREASTIADRMIK